MEKNAYYVENCLLHTIPTGKDAHGFSAPRSLRKARPEKIPSHISHTGPSTLRCDRTDQNMRWSTCKAYLVRSSAYRGLQETTCFRLEKASHQGIRIDLRVHTAKMLGFFCFFVSALCLFSPQQRDRRKKANSLSAERQSVDVPSLYFGFWFLFGTRKKSLREGLPKTSKKIC